MTCNALSSRENLKQTEGKSKSVGAWGASVQRCFRMFKVSIFLDFLKDLHHLVTTFPSAALSFAQMIETDEDFNPLPGGYDYLVDFLDLSFPKERPSREHPYEEVSTSRVGNLSSSSAPSPRLPFLSLSLDPSLLPSHHHVLLLTQSHNSKPVRHDLSSSQIQGVIA